MGIIGQIKCKYRLATKFIIALSSNHFNYININLDIIKSLFGTFFALMNYGNTIIKKGGIMIGLDRLMKIPGIIAAEQFLPDGRTLRKVGEFPDEIMESTAKLYADNNSLMASQVKKIGAETGLNLTPLNGWMIWGGNYAILVVNNTGIIVETKRANFNQLMVDLLGSGPTGPRLMRS